MLPYIMFAEHFYQKGSEGTIFRGNHHSCLFFRASYSYHLPMNSENFEIQDITTPPYDSYIQEKKHQRFGDAALGLRAHGFFMILPFFRSLMHWFQINYFCRLIGSATFPRLFPPQIAKPSRCVFISFLFYPLTSPTIRSDELPWTIPASIIGEVFAGATTSW